MRKLSVGIVVLLSAILLLGCSTRVSPSKVVALVNGVELTQADLDREMRQTRAFYREQYNLNLDDPANAAILKEIRQEALNRIVDQELIRQIAAGIFPPPAAGQSPLAITLSDAEVQDRAKQYEDQVGSRDELLARNGFASYEDFVNFVRGTLRVEKLAQIYGQGDYVHARHILVSTEQEARQVLERLQAGEDFAQVAREVSLDSGSAPSGGDLGWFGRGRMVAPFEQAAFGLEIGQLSGPVRTDFGYHIVQVLEKERRIDAAVFQQWFDGLKAQADIQYMDLDEE